MSCEATAVSRETFRIHELIWTRTQRGASATYKNHRIEVVETTTIGKWNILDSGYDVACYGPDLTLAEVCHDAPALVRYHRQKIGFN